LCGAKDVGKNIVAGNQPPLRVSPSPSRAIAEGRSRVLVDASTDFFIGLSERVNAPAEDPTSGRVRVSDGKS